MSADTSYSYPGSGHYILLRTIAPGCYEEQSLEVTQQQYQGTRPVNLGGYPKFSISKCKHEIGYFWMTREYYIF